LNKTVAAVASSALVLLAVPASGIAGASTTAKPTYVIGYEGPLSGGNAQLGINMKFGVELAIQNANATGKLPFKLQASWFDDQGSSTLSPAQAQSAAANNKLVAVVGPAFSGATRAAEPFYSNAGIATVSPSATAAALATGFSNNNFMRVVYGDDVQGLADANFLVKTHKAKSVLVIDDGSFYGAGLAQVVATDAKNAGATVTTNSLPQTSNCGGVASSTQYTSAATQIARANPTAVFYGGYYCDLGLLLGALSSTSYKGIIMSGDGSESSSLITGTTPASAANGVWLSAAGGGSSTFTGKLETQFKVISHGVKSSTALYSTQAYDATNVIIAAMSTIKWSSDLQLNRIAIKNALHKTSYKGVTGTIAFQSNGNLAGSGAGQVNFYQVKNGVITAAGHN
jgi:branched-chain amino acid transport system substrate-binding protein